MSDLNEISAEEVENIDDEALATLVKTNPYLYDKRHKDFKNVQMKRDTWKVISTCCGAPSGQAAENRWNQLRNMLGRKLRDVKRKPPSGSGGGVNMSPWALMPAMTFLIPHITHRKTRGSITFSHNSTPSTSSSESYSNSQGFKSSSSFSSLDSVCEISTYDEENISNASPLIMPSDNNVLGVSDLDNVPIVIDTTINDGDGKKQQDESDEMTGAFPSKKCKTTVPPPDAFYREKKKNKDKNLELLITKSSSAIQSMAACFTQDTQNKTDKERKMHPFVAAIEVAFEKVPSEMEMECFMAVMNIITKYQ